MQSLPTHLSVGIMTAPRIMVLLRGPWLDAEGQTLTDCELTLTAEADFMPTEADCTFTLRHVTIGKQYHWERQEDQTFTGRLSIVREGEMLTAVNRLRIEDYLVSVISSEMSATAGLEFLKAAAVISRSWVIRQILGTATAPPAPQTLGQADSFIRWFDHEDHTLYDVCADDHCQRYQGITRATNPNVQRAVSETRGEVLSYDGEVCDCRFSKCCGGRMETFDTCWADVDVPYLQPREDRDPKDGTIFCDTRDKAILAQVLNNYDQETTDFYRWTVTYTQAEVSALLSRKLNRDFGHIIELRPLQRGASGRISRLLVRGSRQELIIGKELIIRSALSESHLYSSAFDVEAGPMINVADSVADATPLSVPSHFTLSGKGWGHGVGLCQIGAAVMAHKGYDYRQILAHYYPGAILTK